MSRPSIYVGSRRYGVGPLNALAAAQDWAASGEDAALVDQAGEVDVSAALLEILHTSEAARGRRCERMGWLSTSIGIRRHMGVQPACR